MIGLDGLRILLRPMRAKIANMVARAVVQLVDDDAKLQLLQIGVLVGESIDDAEHFEPLGLTAVPLENAEAVVLFPNGDRAIPLVLAVSDRRFRPRGRPKGTTTLYNTAGVVLELQPNGDIVQSPGGDNLLAGPDSADPVARVSDLEAIKAALEAGVPLPTSSGVDNGAALIESILLAWPTDLGSTIVKVD